MICQTCISANRIFIQDGIYDKFLAKMVELMQNLVIGNGLEKGTTQGPLINEKAVTKVRSSTTPKITNSGSVCVQGYVCPSEMAFSTFCESKILFQISFPP